jgi:transcriptional regulator with XRE-family HTH domain
MTTPPAPDDDREATEALGIASALIKARNALGMTQSELSEQSGISRSAIKGYETGRNMPGSRELRALCKTLRVSPNMLLFGTEQPFAGVEPAADAHPGMRLLLGDPEDAKKARMRLAFLADLLTPDEVDAVLRLLTSLATARHGSDLVSHQIVGADLMTAMALEMQEVARTGGESAKDSAAIRARMEAFMDRNGHKPQSEKRGSEKPK